MTRTDDGSIEQSIPLRDNVAEIRCDTDFYFANHPNIATGLEGEANR
ncbi:MAG: hypothetical protein J7641_17560 [Cyanobacteria bacterium SID2]|nr:hypothetical protein [Cyanobacteria bacterium SID2]MBP0003718.1 hypothetical protein [Cyanobacteria bacterium SBC]